VTVRLPPTPPPSSAATRRAMKGNRRVDTKPEMALRRALHAGGLRYRKDHVVLAGAIRVRVDVVFPRKRVAVFVDGCYWHGCPQHGRMPTRNADYWQAKIARNRDRDRRVTDALAADGWHVVRVWEHEPAAQAAARVLGALSGA
jgi:DNA mismatch endonuclease, patch repair protein